MDSTGQVDLYKLFPDIKRAARYVTRKAGGRDRVDSLGKSPEDYEQDILLAIWKKHLDHGQVLQQRGYYFSVGWNAARTAARTRRRAYLAKARGEEPFVAVGSQEARMIPVYAPEELPARLAITMVEEDPDPLPRLEARACLRRLEKAMSPSDFSVLERLALEETRQESAEGRGESRTSFVRSLREARRKAAAILKEEWTMDQAAAAAVTTTADRRPLAQLGDSELKEQVKCYGESFEVHDDGCMVKCAVRNRCVNILAKRHLPQLTAGLGVARPDLPQIMEALGVDERTGRIVQRVLDGEPVDKVIGPQAVEAPPPAPPPPPPPPVEAAPPPPPEPAPPVPEAPPPAPPPPPRKRKPPPPTLAPGSAAGHTDDPEAQAVPAPSTEVAVVKQKKPTKAAAAPTPKSRVNRVAPTPPKTGMEGVDAFDRERQRSNFVASLADGSLSREYHGKVHTLVVDTARKHYLLDGVAYPTVYSATAAITGMAKYAAATGTGQRTMSSWSAQRFWGAAVEAASGKKPPAARKKAPVKKKARRGKK